jgi:RNA polymerase sigma-70 factor (ECF subfamily)
VGKDAIAEIREGDAAAFADLFRAGAQPVYRWCARSTGPQDAEDLLSIVFLEAWRTRDRAFLVEDSLVPWLLGIAANVTRSEHRHRRRHRAAVERFQSAHPARDTGTDTTEQSLARLDGPLLSDALFSAIASLDSRHAAVAHLCLIESLSPAAAAVVLGLPASTVRSRLATARRRLQRLTQTSGVLDGWLPTGHSLSEGPLPGAPARDTERTRTP